MTQTKKQANQQRNKLTMTNFMLLSLRLNYKREGREVAREGGSKVRE